ncbi:hypothetical protein HJFPF1_04246 [Paramyrothecium foliicola]|nr:hypothetical protein HJFPF1_04246 [Paramyrothecium foliicola]
MKFSAVVTAFVALLGTTDAAHLVTSWTTGPGIIPVYSTVHYGNDGGQTYIGGLFDGCRNNIGGIRRICLDAGQVEGSRKLQEWDKAVLQGDEQKRLGLVLVLVATLATARTKPFALCV